MTKIIKKYKNIYLFILVLSLVGLSSGYIYYQTQPTNIQKELINELNIKESMSSGVNHLPKRTTFIIKTFIYSITIIPQVINIFNIFYLPFETGFILNILESYSIKFSLIYITIYHLIPLILSLILIKIGITLAKYILELIIFKDKLSTKNLKLSLKKYLIVSILLIIYEIYIYIFSININGYLVTFIP